MLSPQFNAFTRQPPLLPLHIKYISDIDECASGTHKCSSNAVCNNTRGSFNCTCNPRYFGDGRQCKSKKLTLILYFENCI